MTTKQVPTTREKACATAMLVGMTTEVLSLVVLGIVALADSAHLGGVIGAGMAIIGLISYSVGVIVTPKNGDWLSGLMVIVMAASIPAGFVLSLLLWVWLGLVVGVVLLVAGIVYLLKTT